MKTIIYIALLLFSCMQVNAQCIMGFTDPQDRWYVFDEGERSLKEFLPITSSKYGLDYIAYIDANNNFKLHKGGITQTLQKFKPEEYHATDNLLVFKNAGKNIMVLENFQLISLGAFLHDIYAWGDSVVAFKDQWDFFNIYYKEKIVEIDIRPSITNIRAAENIVTYYAPGNEFNAFYRGQIYNLDNSIPKSQKIDRNVVAYVDFTGNFNVFYEGEVYELEAFSPKIYEVGENMVVYVDVYNAFKVFYKGEIYELMPIKPKWFEVKENMLVYLNQSGYLYVFYEGKSEQLEVYHPTKYAIDNNIFIYLTYDNYLVGYENGKKISISKEVVNHFELVNQTVLFYQVPTYLRIYCDGEIYQAF